MKLLLYCTKSKPYLYQGFAKPMHTKDITNPFNYNWKTTNNYFSNVLNGKIVAECDFEVEEIECRTSIGMNGIHDEYTTKSLGENELLYASKIDEITFINYLKGKNGYAIHIKNLNIFDKPRELSYYWKNGKKVDRAPQNMMRVQELTNQKITVLKNKEVNVIHLENYIVISVSPQEAARLLNGEQSVLVRKRVLKEWSKR